MKDLVMSSWTAGGWSGSFGGLNNGVQQISERLQVWDGYYNAGSHYRMKVDALPFKHSAGIWTDMCKRQNRKLAVRYLGQLQEAVAGRP